VPRQPPNYFQALGPVVVGVGDDEPRLVLQLVEAGANRLREALVDCLNRVEPFAHVKRAERDAVGRDRWASRQRLGEIRAMDKPRCRQPNRFKRLLAVLRRRCEQTVPRSWLDEPPADPDIGVREPRRPPPDGGARTMLLEPPL